MAKGGEEEDEEDSEPLLGDEEEGLKKGKETEAYGFWDLVTGVST